MRLVSNIPDAPIKAALFATIIGIVVSFTYASNIRFVFADGPCVERNPSGEIVASHPLLADGTCASSTGRNTVTNSQTGAVTAPNTTTDTGVGSGFAYIVAQVVYVFTVGLGSILAAVGALLLNITISFSLDSAAYNLDFISSGWTMLRDIANMSFIFILIYIAIQVMFQAQTHGTVERLVKVLAVALVLNFSFFATRVFIDAGNLVSVQFYNAIVAHDGTSSSTTINLLGNVSSGIPVPDITAKIMQGINFQNALGPDSFKNVTGNDLGDFATGFISYSFIYIALGAMLFMLAAAFVAAGVKFLVRIVMLWFAIITAPLALVMWAFQSGHGDHGGGGGHGHSFSFASWLKNLINHAFYPAVFLFVLLLISNFMASTGDFGAGYIQQTIGSGNKGLPALVEVVANIGVRLGFVLVMLYFALRASDYLEVAGASFANTWGENIVYGGTGWLGRLTLGQGAYQLNKRFNIDEKGNIKNKTVASLLSIPAKQSFNTRSVKEAFEPVGKAIDKRIGSSAGKGGWAEYVHDKEAADKKKQKAEEERIEHEIDHHMGGPKEEAAEQEKFRQAYEGGAAAFDTRVNDLIGEIRKSRDKSVELAKAQAKASTIAEKDKANRDFKANQAVVNGFESQLKALTGMGKRVVEAQNKEKTQKIAIELLSSGKKINYIVAQKLMGKDSKESKLAKAVKDYTDGEGGGEGGAGAGTSATSGGTPPGAPSGHGPTPTVPPAH